MDLEKVREIAKGRVWTGADAKARGLVDEFGGFRAALEATKALAGIPADSEVNLISYPRKRSPAEELAEMFGTTEEVVRTMSLLSKIMGTEPVADAAKLLREEAAQGSAHQLKMIPQETK